MISVRGVTRAAGVAARADTHAAWPTGSSYGGITVRHRLGMGALILLVVVLIGTDIRAETFYNNLDYSSGISDFDDPRAWVQPDPQNRRVPGAQDQVIVVTDRRHDPNTHCSLLIRDYTHYIDTLTYAPGDLYWCYIELLNSDANNNAGLSIARDLVNETGGLFIFGGGYWKPGTSSLVSVGHDIVVGAKAHVDLTSRVTVGHAVSVSGVLMMYQGCLQTSSMRLVRNNHHATKALTWRMCVW
jgi:hypothetical protein